MIIETGKGDRDEIEKTLDEYGMVIKGEKSPEGLLTDLFQIQDLKNQLRLAHVQIEQKTELLRITEKQYDARILSLEEHVNSLRSNIGNALQTNFTSLSIIDKLIDHNANIRNELTELKKLLENPDPSKNDREKAEQLLKSIKTKEPGVF